MFKTLNLFSFRLAIMIVTTSVLFTSCNTDEVDLLDVPSTYTFTRDGSNSVVYSGQTERLDMLALMTTYLKTSNTVGSATLDANTLKNMFRNEGSPFGVQSYSKNLISKCFAADTLMFLQFMDEAAVASAATGTASNGTAGVLVDGSSDPTVGYRVDANGVEMTQVIEKGLMGSVFFYQVMEVYLSGERMGAVGNSELVDDKNYTNMEHYFDEAFGYFGAPVDFPSGAMLEDNGFRFWSKYCNSREEGLYPGINNEIALAFRTGRAAIVAKDYDVRDEAIQTIQQKWAIVIAASAVSYLNQALSAAGTDEYKRHHKMSEAVGFMLGLKYHFAGGNSKYPPHFTHMHIGQALSEIGPSTNLYTVTDTNIESAINHIKMAFPSGEIK
ncbi:MAG: hypothetical protein ACI9UR_000530 [Bacteroidia bacterium]|jgi:hypothetical protein